MEIDRDNLLSHLEFCRKNECVEWYEHAGSIAFRTVKLDSWKNYVAAPNDTIASLLKAIKKLEGGGGMFENDEREH